jgi:hypothetical protein
MTLQSPNPFPTEGLRKLSGKETMQRSLVDALMSVRIITKGTICKST